MSIEINQIAQSFANSILSEHPIYLYYLEAEVSNYLNQNNISLNGLPGLFHYPNLVQEVQNSAKNSDGSIDSDVHDYIITIQNDGLLTLICYILRNENVRFGPTEIDKSLEDTIMANKWVYHKNTKTETLQRHAAHEFDTYNQEDNEG